ncbi:acetylglutamate kinase [Pontibacter sp. G13]|uniref:acetylglutamate kinase n=1 Tax=Pontibacter sp. G13 TaxID=3074898 RepID=UPI0028894763|nr:acetylglutamate kinase [Pontibacter sp. G13]WNJ16394.1 acetylglutamate kinase [Pontibacter sp. G13]
MNRLTILKIGGHVLADPAKRTQLLADFAQLPGAKVLVHGGGKTGTQIAERLGIQVQMVDGRRITDKPMLEVAMMVYGGLKNKQLVASLQALGINALGITGADMNVIQAIKRPVKTIDYGWVGDIVAVDGDRLAQLIQAGITPVMAPLTHDGQGNMLNTNADTIASVVAQALSAFYEVHLVYGFEKPGVMIDPDDDQTLIQQLTPSSYADHRQQGHIVGGMIPKLDNAFDALNHGVNRVYICSQSALSGLHTPQFIGTEILIPSTSE